MGAVEANPYHERVDWNDLRHFLAVARTGSVRTAAGSLGVSHSTVLRRVEALEERLGARLFDRSRDGFVLTRAGHDMLPAAERIEAETAVIERTVLGLDRHLEGRISITCADPWVVDVVLSGLRPFCDAHPGIPLHVGEDSKLFDMSKREADIAIRAMPVGKDPPAHLIGARVAPMHLGVYVATEHRERLDPARAGSQPRWVAYDDEKVHQQLAATTPLPSLDAWGGFSSMPAMVTAIKLGYGIGMLPSYVGDAEPTLQRLPQDAMPHLGDLWLLSHPDLRTNARLQACRRDIVAIFERERGRFDGTAST